MRSTRANKGMFGVSKPSKSGGKTAKKPDRHDNRKQSSKNTRSVPVNPANPEDNPAYISFTALNATKYGSIVAAVLAVLSAIPVFVRALGITSVTPTIFYGLVALIAVCIIAITILIRTDLQVRAATRVAAIENPNVPSGADEEDEGTDEEDEESPDEDAVIYEAPAATVPTAERFAVKLHEGDGRLVVLAIGWNPETGDPAYLVGKPGKKPRWIDDDEVQTACYEADSAHPLHTENC